MLKDIFNQKNFINSESILRKEFVKKNTEFENKHYLSEIVQKRISQHPHKER